MKSAVAVLTLNQNFFKSIDLLGLEKKRSVYQNVRNIIFVSLDLFIIVPAAIYFVQHLHNLRKALECMFGLTAFSLGFSIHIYFLFNRNSLQKILNELQELVEQRMNRPYFVNYEKVEAKITNFTKIFTIVTTGICSVVLTMPFILAAFANFQPNRLFLPFKTTYPFDQTSPVGYSAAACIQLLAGWKYCVSFCAINTFYIGVCWYVEACINEIQTIFNDIEMHLTKRENDEADESNSTKFAIRRVLLEAVDFHNRILEFINHFANMMDGVVFLTFSFGSIWLSTSLAQYMGFNFAMFQTTVSNSLILVWLFIYCFYGHLVSFKCAQVGEFAYNSKFYQYPIELKWFTLFMIARSQRPFFITGYRITKCSLESYARFVRAAISIYMLFRNLSN